MFVTVSLLGSKFDTTLDMTIHLNPETGRYTYFETRSLKGDRKDALQVFIEGEKARFWIPAELAYGTKPARPGAPVGMLVYDIELVGIR